MLPPTLPLSFCAYQLSLPFPQIIMAISKASQVAIDRNHLRCDPLRANSRFGVTLLEFCLRTTHENSD
jgi:hypothetical protein